MVVGIEGTGAYGAGLARYLHDEHVPMLEIDRPNSPCFLGRLMPAVPAEAGVVCRLRNRSGWRAW